jgi:hypothetical protein
MSNTRAMAANVAGPAVIRADAVGGQMISDRRAERTTLLGRKGWRPDGT